MRCACTSPPIEGAITADEDSVPSSSTNVASSNVFAAANTSSLEEDDETTSGATSWSVSPKWTRQTRNGPPGPCYPSCAPTQRTLPSSDGHRPPRQHPPPRFVLACAHPLSRRPRLHELPAAATASSPRRSDELAAPLRVRPAELPSGAYAAPPSALHAGLPSDAERSGHPRRLPPLRGPTAFALVPTPLFAVTLRPA